jgi:hypothetical protein
MEEKAAKKDIFELRGLEFGIGDLKDTDQSG